MCIKTNARLSCLMAIALLAIGCTAAIAPNTANADLIGVDGNLLPDINAYFLSANYDPGGGSLTVFGFPSHYGDASGPDISALDGNLSFNLNVTLDPSGTTPMTVASGDISVYGSLADDGGFGNGELLLSGTVDHIGSLLNAAEGYAIFDFSFLVTGGSLANDFGGADVGRGGTKLVVRYDDSAMDVAFSNSFLVPFSYNGLSNTADTYSLSPVPEPSSAILLASMVAGVLGVTLRRSRIRRDIGSRMV